jgi:hypothetical protein|tara:strand:+ start:20 stop:562 length:543 start_codon:yes stop_codon:yes gene_type:complete
MEVIDNFLPQEQFNDLVGHISSNTFPWYFSSDVAYSDNRKDFGEEQKFADAPMTHEQRQWSFYSIHTVYFNHQKLSTNEVWEKVKPLLDKTGVKSLLRMKVNMYPKTPKVVHHKDHLDYPWSHNGAIFYLNDNDGITVLNDGTEVESVANRILLFDSSKPHHSTTCTNADRRLNINFNYF